jgi:Ca2+-binding RTX toxin-like protein
MVPAGFGTYVAPSPDVLMGASWAAPDLVAQGQDAGAPMPQGAEGRAMTIQGTPNDSRYTDGSLWGMYGDSSSPTNQYGSQAAEAWAQGHTGSMANVIGVIDSGIDYTHPDLYLNIWLNQREIPTTLRASLSDIDEDGLITFRDLNGSANAAYVLDYNSDGRIDAGDLLNDIRWENGVDEDGNGYLDDLIGWDFANNDNDPMDDSNHGTHVAGTIGALGGNAIGVAGVNWQIQMVALKFLPSSGPGLTSDSTRAVNYFTTAAIGARASGSTENFVATNNSYGSTSYNEGLLAAITKAALEDILFVTIAGNSARNIDYSWESRYPSNYSTSPTSHEAVISVASITSAGALSSSSNYGMNSVDLAAPGNDVWSTFPNSEYGANSGTSMAAPHVAGAIALYASLFPNATSAQIREALLRSATFTASVNDLVATDGRLNIPAMLAIAPPVTVFADWLDGSNNAETLNGLDGNDTLDGGAGDDTLDGGVGTDLVSFLGATDAVTVNLASNRALGAAGSDSLYGIENALGGAGADSLLGDSLANLLIGAVGNDSVNGGNGADTLDGGLGADSLIGEAGIDLVSYAGATGAVTVSLASNMVTGAAGSDNLSDIENVLGGVGADSLVGSLASNQLDGGDGSDTLDGGFGADTLIGGVGLDLASFSGATASVTANLISNLVSGAAGNDSLFGIENVLGGAANDSLLGNGEANQLYGAGGADTIDGGRGDDSLFGGAGTDLLYYFVESSGDSVTVDLARGKTSSTRFGNDHVSGFENVLGTTGSDCLVGDASTNELSGNFGHDSLDGGVGNDILDGGFGDDSLAGGAGLDFVSYADATGAITVNLAAGLALGAHGNDSLLSVENVRGGKKADSLLGDSLMNQLDGGADSDTLTGGEGDDWLNGGSGSGSLVFALAEGNPFSFVDVGINAKPAFSDLDNDGDLDLVVGRGDGDVLCFRRNSDGSFTAITGEYPENPFFGLDVGWDSAPVFVDDDGDGDQDLIVGGYDGTLTNVGIGLGIGRNYRGIDVGFNSAPVFFDFDLDGDQDMLLGDSRGGFAAYRREPYGGFTPMDGRPGYPYGNPVSPFYRQDVGTLSAPSFVDLDFDGDFDLVSGESSGTLFAFMSNGYGSYGAVGSWYGWPVNPFAGIDVGWNSAPIFTDIDNDGVLDLVIGAGDGTLRLYSGQLTNRDSLSGGTGADTLEGLDGADTLDGGEGDDLVSYAAAAGAVTVNLATNLVTGASGSDVLSGIEHVLGGPGADSLLGDAAPNKLLGGNGADTLEGGLGEDSLIGGFGNDLFTISDTLDVIIEAANGGADTILTSVSMTMPDHIEALRIATDVSGVSLTGGAGNDILVGNGLTNTFNGGTGDDVILAGNFTLADIYALFAT